MSNRESEGDPTEPESNAYGAERNFGGVISGEATPPDEHTRRVAAMKSKQGKVPEPTVHTVHDETLTAVPSEPDPRHEQLARQAKESARRGGVTHDSPTEARVPAPVKAYEKPRAEQRAEAPPPRPAAPKPAVQTTPAPAASSAPAAESASAAPAAPAAPDAVVPAPEQPSSRHLAERSVRERRRDRDRRAEKAALRAVVVVFAAIGGIGIWVVNSDLFNEPESDTPSQPAKQIEKRVTKQRPVTSTPQLDETPDLPALRMLAREGLTIAAEGIPEVTASDESAAAAALATIETCRYAFGVWEFSPNKRFRFLTTCEGLEGQILVGAYAVQGSVIKMSPLTDGPATMISELEVEKPSHMTTRVDVNAGGRAVSLSVNQQVSTIRGGLQGEAFRDTYIGRNPIKLQPRGGGAPQQPREGGGLREMLQPR